MEVQADRSENHQVVVDTALTELMTLLQGHSEKLTRGQLTNNDGTFDEEQHQQVRVSRTAVGKGYAGYGERVMECVSHW